MIRQGRIIILALTALFLVACSQDIPNVDFEAYDIDRDPPLYFVDAQMRENSIGEPVFNIRVRNMTPWTVDAFMVEVDAYDDYGNRLRKFGFGGRSFRGISQNDVRPGGYQSGSWTLHGYDLATRIEYRVTSVLFTNGHEWTPTNDVSIEGAAQLR